MNPAADARKEPGIPEAFSSTLTLEVSREGGKRRHRQRQTHFRPVNPQLWPFIWRFWSLFVCFHLKNVEEKKTAQPEPLVVHFHDKLKTFHGAPIFFFCVHKKGPKPLIWTCACHVEQEGRFDFLSVKQKGEEKCVCSLSSAGFDSCLRVCHLRKYDRMWPVRITDKMILIWWSVFFFNDNSQRWHFETWNCAKSALACLQVPPLKQLASLVWLPL